MNFRRLTKRGTVFAVALGVGIGYVLAGRGVDLIALLDYLRRIIGFPLLFVIL